MSAHHAQTTIIFALSLSSLSQWLKEVSLLCFSFSKLLRNHPLLPFSTVLLVADYILYINFNSLLQFIHVKWQIFCNYDRFLFPPVFRARTSSILYQEFPFLYHKCFNSNIIFFEFSFTIFPQLYCSYYIRGQCAEQNISNFFVFQSNHMSSNPHWRGRRCYDVISVKICGILSNSTALTYFISVKSEKKTRTKYNCNINK